MDGIFWYGIDTKVVADLVNPENARGGGIVGIAVAVGVILKANNRVLLVADGVVHVSRAARGEAELHFLARTDDSIVCNDYLGCPVNIDIDTIGEGIGTSGVQKRHLVVTLLGVTRDECRRVPGVGMVTIGTCPNIREIVLASQSIDLNMMSLAYCCNIESICKPALLCFFQFKHNNVYMETGQA